VNTLANHKSAIKRNAQSQKRRLRNRTVKTRVKTAVKKIYLAEASGAASDITSDMNSAQSIIDKASKKGVLHPRTAARKISRLTKQANQLKGA
jgi:small subunit ribosomal protein S20